MNKLLALPSLAVLLFLLYFITPYLADIVGRSIDQTLDQRRSEVERIIEAREANDRAEIAALRRMK